MHEEILKCFDIHLLYLGHGLFVELTEWDVLLEVIENPDPHVQSMIIRELTIEEQSAYDEVLHSGLGTGSDERATSKPKDTMSHTVITEEKMCSLDLTVFAESIPESKVNKETLPLDLSLDPISTTSSDNAPTDEQKDTESTTVTAEEVAQTDEPLAPSPPPVIPKPKEHLAAPLRSEIKIWLNKLDLKLDQSVKVTEEILSQLPASHYDHSGPLIKDELDEAVHSDGSDSTILYSWLDEPVFPEKYKKPRFKVPPSLISPKPKRKNTARFSVKTRGLLKWKICYWFKCIVPNCGQTFPNIKAWNQHHDIHHQNFCLACSVCKRVFHTPSSKRAHKNAPHCPQASMPNLPQVF